MSKLLSNITSCPRCSFISRLFSQLFLLLWRDMNRGSTGYRQIFPSALPPHDSCSKSLSISDREKEERVSGKLNKIWWQTNLPDKHDLFFCFSPSKTKLFLSNPSGPSTVDVHPSSSGSLVSLFSTTDFPELNSKVDGRQTSDISISIVVLVQWMSRVEKIGFFWRCFKSEFTLRAYASKQSSLPFHEENCTQMLTIELIQLI